MRGVVVGLGVMGQHHLRVLRSLGTEGVFVGAVVEPDRERRDSVVQSLAGCRSYATLEDALSSEELDFACIATPTELLPETAAEALGAGLHVLVEKPMAPDLARAQELLAFAETRPQVLVVGLVERCNPAVRALKDKLADGQAGHVLQMHARRLSPFPKRGSKPGVALDLATHDIDVMRFLIDAEVDRVYAETASAGGDREDLVCATMRFANGTTGVLECNWISPTKVRQLSVTCERGMFVVDYLSQDLTFFEHPTKATVWEPLRGLRGGGEGDMIRYAIERWEPLRLEWEGFLAAVRSGAGAPAGGAEGCAAVAVADAIRASGSEHTVVEPDQMLAVSALA